MGNYADSTSGPNPYGTIGHQSDQWEIARKRAAQEDYDRQVQQHEADMQAQEIRSRQVQHEREERDAQRREREIARQQQKAAKKASQSSKASKPQTEPSVFKFSFVVAFLVFLIAAGVIYSMGGTSMEQSLISGGIAGVLMGFLWRVVVGLAVLSGILYVVYLTVQTQ